MNFKINLKKIVSFVLIFIFLIPLNFKIVRVYSLNRYSLGEYSNKIKDKTGIGDLPAKSYILMDYNTGQVLYEKNPDEKLPIASITKIMTMLLIVEAIENKKLSLDDMATATENAKPANDESSVWLEVGEKMSVKDLLKAVAVNSCNDAARILAEHVAGSEEDFVKLMNKKAKEIGLKNTNFCNASGLDVENHYSTARDIANLTAEIMKYKWITNYTSLVKGTLKNGSFKLNNTNLLLQTYKGCNGFKTGTTKTAGNCLCATACRNNMFLCAVSLGSNTKKETLQTCRNLLDYGFNNFQVISSDSEEIEQKEVAVKKGNKAVVGCVIEDSDVCKLIKKVEAKDIKKKIKIKDEVKAPVKKGQSLGSIEYLNKENKKIFSRNVVASEDVEGLNFLTVFYGLLKSFFAGSEFYE